MKNKTKFAKTHSSPYFSKQTQVFVFFYLAKKIPQIPAKRKFILENSIKITKAFILNWKTEKKVGCPNCQREKIYYNAIVINLKSFLF